MCSYTLDRLDSIDGDRASVRIAFPVSSLHCFHLKINRMIESRRFRILRETVRLSADLDSHGIEFQPHVANSNLPRLDRRPLTKDPNGTPFLPLMNSQVTAPLVQIVCFDITLCVDMNENDELKEATSFSLFQEVSMKDFHLFAARSIEKFPMETFYPSGNRFVSSFRRTADELILFINKNSYGRKGN